MSWETSGTRRKSVTLADVAKRASVSVMTASNVLNGKGRFGEATQLRVQHAAADLGYVPNLSASRLVGASLAQVGVVFPAGDSAFLTTLIAGIATVAASRGLQIALLPLDPLEPVDIAGVTDGLVSAGAQGVLFVAPFAELVSAEMARTFGVPLAGIVTASPLPGIATVRIDNHAASHAVAAMLARQGHHRIGVICGAMNHSDSVARLEGHRSGLRDAGIPHDRDLEVQGDFSFASGIAGASALIDLASAPTAIVAANDEMAAGALWLLNSRGVRVPEDIAVCGFDDNLLATRVWPTLTTVRQPIEQMAAVALDALSAAFKAGPGQDASSDTLLPFEVIERGSTIGAEQ